MKRLGILAAAVLFAVVSDPAVAAGVKVFEKTAGVWKASCFKEPGVADPFCRVMVVHKFKDGARTGNFVQFGPAWDRGNMGVVVASYLGFTRESWIQIRIDDGEPVKVVAPLENHYVFQAEQAAPLVESMKAGKVVHLRFKPATGVNQDLAFPLHGFPALTEEIGPVLAGEGK